MNYECLGQNDPASSLTTPGQAVSRNVSTSDIFIADDNLSLEHARKKGIHDAASDVVRITTLALVAIGIFTILPDKWINKGKKQIRGFLP